MALLGWILAFALGVPQATVSPLFLDLTAPSVNEMDRSKTKGCGSAGAVYTSGQPIRPPQLTLTLEIERLNENQFTLGAAVVVDLRLTNTGEKPVVLPWDPDSDIVYGRDCEDFRKPAAAHTLLGSLAVKVVGTEGKANFVAGHELFGLHDDPETYRILAPQQSAHIRVSGKLDLSPAAIKALSSGATNHFKFIAVFDLTDTSMPNRYATVVSANPKDVIVSGKSN